MTEYQCIECGKLATELYRDFNKAGVIKIKHCDYCNQVVDKYIEYDSVMIFLDALLHKPQAYRHLLFNASIQSHWKLLLIFLFCDTYMKWDFMHKSSAEIEDDHIFYAALEWDFYRMFSLALVEWTTFCLSALLIFEVSLNLAKIPQPENARSAITKALIVSSFGKLMAIPAIIWGQTNSVIYLWLTRIFIFTSNVAAIKVICGLNKVICCVLIATASILQFTVGQYYYGLVARVGK